MLIYINIVLMCVIARMVAAVVTTLAGGTSGYADGIGVAASFKGPNGVFLDTNRVIYMADYTGQRVVKITTAGFLSHFLPTVFVLLIFLYLLLLFFYSCCQCSCDV